MKNLLVSLLVVIPLVCFSQQTINKTIVVDGISRTFILYVPAIYTPDTLVPVVLNFHGYTESSNTQMVHRNFRPIADTANFLVVHPQGTKDNLNNTHWNVGLGMSTVDDVNFISALLDSLSQEYSIDTTRIYAAGFSNGGGFSLKLACDLSYRIAAVASVGGPFANHLETGCHPQRPVPFMLIHGTTDGVVPYTGNATYSSAASVLEFWNNFNATDTTPVITTLPNISTTDNSKVELHVWSDGTNGVEVQHYKIIGGGHNWPGSTMNGQGNFNQDIKASEKIWQFFARFDLNGALTSVHDNLIRPEIEIFPNPFNSETTIVLDKYYSELSLHIFNSLGQLEETISHLNGDRITLNRNGLTAGLHYVSLSNENFIVTRKIMVVD